MISDYMYIKYLAHKSVINGSYDDLSWSTATKHLSVSISNSP